MRARLRTCYSGCPDLRTRHRVPGAGSRAGCVSCTRQITRAAPPGAGGAASSQIKLAAANPDRYGPSLARLLERLTIVSSELGLEADADTEAKTIQARTMPDSELRRS